VGQAIVFCGLLEWAAGPRISMKIMAQALLPGTFACRAGTRAGAWHCIPYLTRVGAVFPTLLLVTS
jgi:hypothetical protein